MRWALEVFPSEGDLMGIQSRYNGVTGSLSRSRLAGRITSRSLTKPQLGG
jgi:hypothetical protein